MLRLTLALSLLVTICRGQDNTACDLSQEAVMKMAMECVAHDPKLMMEIIEHMKHPDEMENMKFACDNQKDLVDVAICMEGKLVGCLPREAQPLVLKFVSRDRLEALFKFACDHQAELLNPCMDDKSSLMLSMCLHNETTSLTAAFIYQQPYTSELQQAYLCKFSAAFKSCMATYHGSCSQSYTDLFNQLIEMMLPEHHCDKKQVDVKNALRSKLLGSLLLDGHPMSSNPRGSKYLPDVLRFDPSGKSGPTYRMKRN